MAVYYGVVHHNRVELDAEAGLSEGVRVEVRPIEPVLQHVLPETLAGADASEAEQAFWRDMIAAGIIDAPPQTEDGPVEPFELVRVRGRPLSEDIIEERR